MIEPKHIKVAMRRAKRTRSVFRMLSTPHKADVLTTYRTLLRAVRKVNNPLGWGERPESYRSTAAWQSKISESYRANQAIECQKTTAKLHNEAVELAHCLQANALHDHHLREGGWTLNKQSNEQLEGVANYVGLGLPEVKSYAAMDAEGNAAGSQQQ